MKQTIIFSGTCAAGSELTLVSKRIVSKFRTVSFNASFALNTNRTLQLKFFHSPDSSAPAVGTPTGVSMLATLGEDAYLVGDDEQKNLEHEVSVTDIGRYLKVHANNTDTVPHTVDCFIVIDI